MIELELYSTVRLVCSVSCNSIMCIEQIFCSIIVCEGNCTKSKFCSITNSKCMLDVATVHRSKSSKVIWLIWYPVLCSVVCPEITIASNVLINEYSTVILLYKTPHIKSTQCIGSCAWIKSSTCGIVDECILECDGITEWFFHNILLNTCSKA